MKNAEKLFGKRLLLVSFLALGAFIFIAVWIALHKKPPVSGTKIDRIMPNQQQETKPKGVIGREATEPYIRQVEQKTAEEAARAEKEGRNYVSPLLFEDNINKDDPDRIQELLEQRRRQAEQAQRLRRRTALLMALVERQYQRDDAAAAAISEALKDVRGKRTHHNDVLIKDNLVLAVAESGKSAPPAAAAGGGETRAQQIPAWLKPFEEALKPGQVLYASLELNLDSDWARQGVVVSKVIAGPLQGATVIGHFRTGRGRNPAFKIEFDRMVLPNGKEIGLTAFAVDPHLKLPFIAHEVDRHYLYRWGSLVAASFLEGWAEFADATAQSGTQTATTAGAGGSVTVQATPHYSLTERGMIASGRVADVLAQQLANNFRREPTVKARATADGGMPIGILVVDSPVSDVYRSRGQQGFNGGSETPASMPGMPIASGMPMPQRYGYDRNTGQPLTPSQPGAGLTVAAGDRRGNVTVQSSPILAPRR